MQRATEPSLPATAPTPKDDTPQPPGPLVVVAGATGYLGGQTVLALHQAGFRVRALARNPDKLAAIQHAVDEVFVGEATVPSTLRGLCDGAFAVFSSIGLRQLGRRPTFWQVDRDANIAIATEAALAGVKRFVFVSVHGAPERRAMNPLFEAKEQVVDWLVQSPLQSTVLRPTGLFNDMQELFDMARAGRIWVFAQGEARVNPIHGADVGERVAELLRQDHPAASVDLGGPETFTMRQIGELAAQALHKEVPVTSLPLGLLKWGARLLRPFHLNLSAMMSFFYYVNRWGAVAEPVPGRSLRDYYRDLAGA